MSYIIILLVSIISVIILKIIIGTRVKDIRNIAENKKLDEISNKFPENTKICESMLKMLNNENVKITENTENKSSFYFIATNTINIANIKDSFTRIQTIAHECIHSIQDKKLLWFNYIISNFYIIYFLAISILTIIKRADYITCLSTLFIVNLVWIFIREFLEVDAMTKAIFLAEKYMELNKSANETEIEELVREYEKLNEKGIKLANFQIFLSGIVRIIIYLIILNIMQFI